MTNANGNAAFEQYIRYLETDIYDNAKPSTMIRLGIDGVSQKAEQEGAPFEKLLEEINAVWMLARLRYEQFLPVRGGDTLSVEITPRSIEGSIYFREAFYYNKAGSLAAKCTMASMAVEKDTRHIFRASEIDRMFEQPPREIESLGLRRLRVREDLPDTAKAFVRYSDCDANGHLAGTAYADFACECAGYWDSPKLCTELQIDYSSECPAGSTIELASKHSEDGFLLRGTRQDGTLSFTAGGRFSCIVN
jgi:acyl-CoA thioesterase FadM